MQLDIALLVIRVIDLLVRIQSEACYKTRFTLGTYLMAMDNG